MPQRAPSPSSSFISTEESLSCTGVKKNSLVSKRCVAEVRVKL